MAEEYHFFQSVQTRLVYLGSCILMSLACLYLLHITLWFLPLVLGCLPFSVPLTVITFKRLLRRQELLTIDAAGITDRIAVICAGHIPWSEITQIRITSNKYFVIMQLSVASFDKFCDQFHGFHRRALQLNGKIYALPIQIHLTRRDCDPDELFHVIEGRYTALFGEQQ